MDARGLRAALTGFAVLGISGCGGSGGAPSSEAAAPADPPVNRLPTISGSPSATAIADTLYSFTPTASDPDGDALVFGVDGLPAWLEQNKTTGQISGKPGVRDVGRHRGIVIWVSDGDDQSVLPPHDIEVVPEPPPDNSAPVLTGTPASEVQVGSGYDFTPIASDVDGDPLSFEIENRPDWADFDVAIGRLSGIPDSGDIGVYTGIAIRVSDGLASAEVGPFAISVNPLPTENRAPLISGSPDPDVVAGEAWSFQPLASDPDGDALSFQAVGRPAWMSFDSATGYLGGTPGDGDLGVHSGIQLVVSDGQASASLPAFSVEVSSSNSAPTIGGTPDAVAVVGTAYRFEPVAHDPDSDPLAFTATGLPVWASLDPGTGALTGTPLAGHEGAYAGIGITVSDGAASATLGPFSITVAAANRPPVIGGLPSSTVAVGQFYSFTPSASDPDGDTLSFTIGGRPSWASFDGTTGTLSGTPQSVAVHTDIVITVRDVLSQVSLPAFSISVFAPNSPPSISGMPAATALVGTAYSFTPTASDPDGDPLTFTATGLPDWVTFSPGTGALTGTPQAQHVGSFSGISITVSDGSASATLGPFSVLVQATANGTVLISWMAPTENTDGSPLVDLAGYVVYWGTASGNYPNSVRLTNPGSLSYLLENLLPGATYYFVTTAFNSQGVESVLSNEATYTVP